MLGPTSTCAINTAEKKRGQTIHLSLDSQELRLTVYFLSLFVGIINQWNALPNEIAKANNFIIFRGKLRKLLNYCIIIIVALCI